MPKTPLRALRVPDELWQAALARASERGETVSEVVRRGLVRYVDAVTADDEVGEPEAGAGALRAGAV